MDGQPMLMLQWMDTHTVDTLALAIRSTDRRPTQLLQQVDDGTAQLLLRQMMLLHLRTDDRTMRIDECAG